ncbi:hypothetical protein N4G70_09080 [Streptomyces sp. ASQP_92]|uniref:hypothetical protein n=1 Tax=Streptomyces sp. ASQP_92 TaxID=2979116 RepID=UPI0021C084F7|nr:hypothetical protein [Streptomyces sp. ASQP_92]MCT9089020.1 hypothetical protein [Streptomyces sp. ASQP_92]
MLRIVDELAGPGPLRVYAHAPADGDPGTGLRVLLTADVLARVVEMRGRAVLIGWTGPKTEAAAAIRPPDAEGDPERIAQELGGPPGVQLTSGTYEGAGVACLQIGRAALPPLEGLDPLAVRLMLLSHPYEEPVSITAEEITEAGAALARWRRSVAAWAEHPSKPIPTGLKATARTALDHRLDTSAVLRLLHDLATADDVPEGAKFETVAHLDRVLSLELVREVGLV